MGNLLRGDVARLQRCTSHITGAEGSLPRVKPFKYAYEKEIVLYAYFKKLDYFATECVYAPDAYRGHARALVKDLEALRPSAIIDIIHAGNKTPSPTAAQRPLQSHPLCCPQASSWPWPTASNCRRRLRAPCAATCRATLFAKRASYCKDSTKDDPNSPSARATRLRPSSSPNTLPKVSTFPIHTSTSSSLYSPSSPATEIVIPRDQHKKCSLLERDLFI